MTVRRRIQRFEIVEQIGIGGAGQVYHGRDPELERDVAIKVLAVPRPPTELSPDDTLDLRNDGPVPRDELLREARMMARLSHPNVLPVYEVGLAGDAMFLVMEHIDGSDLATWLDQPRSTEAILDVFLQAARGLAAAHHRGIVHRDVKPGNILIDRDGRVRVADFGLSRLTARSPTAMVYVNDGRGTPGYMAPELFRGEPATPRSDVYALCVALVEALGGEPASAERALRDRGIPGRVRRITERGLADDPAVRPAVAELVAALGRRPPRWRIWAIGATAGAAIVAAVVLRSSPAESLVCEPDPARLSPHWNPERLAALRGALAAQPGSRTAAERIVSDIAAQQRAIDASLAGACDAARASQITRDQYASRASCLQRRVFALTATIDLLVDTPLNLLRARDRLETSPLSDECAGMTAAPIAGDPAAAKALWRRYIRSGTMAVPKRANEHIAELTAVAAAAAETGETELVARSTRWLAIEQRFNGDYELAEDTFQRAYRMALDLKASALVALLLVDRGTLALLRDDPTAARNSVDLARDLADSQATSPQIQARIALLRGRTLNRAGDFTGARDTLRRALDTLTRDGTATGSVELDVRDNLLAALAQIDVQVPQTIALANETAELTRELVGEREMRYGWALDLVATALSAADDHVRAATCRRKAVEILTETLPSDNSFPRRVHSSLVIDLYNLGDLASAQDEIAKLRAIPVKNPDTPWGYEGWFAAVAFDRGERDDGLARAAEALEDEISAYGKNHPDSLELRGLIATMELEVGQLDDAARHIAAMDAGYRAQPDIHQLRRIRLSGRLAAELAIARGRPRDAEAAARHALAVADERHATDHDRAQFHATLGRSLVAQRRWAEARSALEMSLAYLAQLRVRRDEIAAVEIELAIAEAGLGQRAAALARARRARAVLDDYPGRMRARDHADRLLGRSHAPRRGSAMSSSPLR